jgi:ligand-binding sensor domain-containing protein
MNLKTFAASLLLAMGFGCVPEAEKMLGQPAFVKSDYTDTVSTTGPQRMVRNVRQARNGDMLIAAYNGIFRYNGKTFTNITSRIPSPSFWDVLEDRHGNLWMASKDSGVYRFDGQSFLHYSKGKGLLHNTALHLFEDKAGHIWISNGQVVSRFDGKTFRHFTQKDGLPEGGVNTFMEDKTGRLWIGTRTDACFWEEGKLTVFRNEAGESYFNVWGFAEDRKGNIWFGGSILKEKRASTLYLDVGLWRYDGQTYQKVLEKSVSSLFTDQEGNLWTLGTESLIGSGKWQLTRFGQKTLYEAKPAGTEIFSFKNMLCQGMQAQDGSIWFGSGKGVFRFDGKRVQELSVNN